MDSQLFFYLNLGLGAFFLIWFLSARKNRGPMPTRLKMRQFRPESMSVDDSAVKNAKKLNVLFLYNGHDWDAYAVLGVPAGASLSLVTERYQQLVKESPDRGQIEFYQAAYNAILQKV